MFLDRRAEYVGFYKHSQLVNGKRAQILQVEQIKSNIPIIAQSSCRVEVVGLFNIPMLKMHSLIMQALPDHQCQTDH